MVESILSTKQISHQSTLRQKEENNRYSQKEERHRHSIKNLDKSPNTVRSKNVKKKKKNIPRPKPKVTKE